MTQQEILDEIFQLSFEEQLDSLQTALKHVEAQIQDEQDKELHRQFFDLQTCVDSFVQAMNQ